MGEFGEEEAGLEGYDQALAGEGADQQLEGYTAEQWEQHGAYAAAMGQMPWFPVPYWQPMPPGARWRKPGKPTNFSGLQGGHEKARFCATFPNVNRCRHGVACTFAHSREEISAPLLSEEEETYVPHALTEEFFIERYKTLWCPIGAQHDWQVCMYAHTFQDARRPPSIGYGHQLCPYWNKKETNLAYSQRCPLGPRCPHAHGAKEQLYHPSYFRTLVCRDLQRRRCPRGPLCAFFHKQANARRVGPDEVDYSMPLKKEAGCEPARLDAGKRHPWLGSDPDEERIKHVPAEWVSYFLDPPRFQEAAGVDMSAAFAAGMPFGMPGGCGGCMPGFPTAEGGASSSSGPGGPFMPGDFGGAARLQQPKPGRGPLDSPRTQTTAEDAGSAVEAEEGGEDSVEELSGGEEASLQMAAAAGTWAGPPAKGGEAEAYWAAMQYQAPYGMYPGYYPVYNYDGAAAYPQVPMEQSGWGKGGGGGGKGQRRSGKAGGAVRHS